MNAENRRVYSQRIETLTNAIGYLEGQAFGAHFRFAAFGPGLHHSCDGGWTQVEGFTHTGIPGLREFANRLNAAVEPVCKAYAEELRQALANECVKLASRALTKEPE